MKIFRLKIVGVFNVLKLTAKFYKIEANRILKLMIYYTIAKCRRNILIL